MSDASGTRRDPAVLDLHVAELNQLFNSMDPAPFRERDLDPRAEEFIVEWARETSSKAALSLAVHVGRAGAPDEAAILQQAVAEFFEGRALAKRRELRKLLRTGRISLLIGLAFVAVVFVLADLASNLRYGFLEESLVIGGWVALWRPLEILLYDWWPIRADARFFERLARMPVELRPAA